MAALLGGEVILTDLPDRLRLLQKNVDENMKQLNLKVVPSVQELTWGEEIDPSLITPPVDFGKCLFFVYLSFLFFKVFFPCQGAIVLMNCDVD